MIGPTNAPGPEDRPVHVEVGGFVTYHLTVDEAVALYERLHDAIMATATIPGPGVVHVDARRKAFQRQVALRRRLNPPRATFKPRYDEVYFEGVAKMDADARGDCARCFGTGLALCDCGCGVDWCHDDVRCPDCGGTGGDAMKRTCDTTGPRGGRCRRLARMYSSIGEGDGATTIGLCHLHHRLLYTDIMPRGWGILGAPIHVQPIVIGGCP